MMELAALLAEVLRSRDWEVRSGRDLGARLSAFDFVAESEAAVVFFKALTGEGLAEEVEQLTATVASATATANLGAKAWESYLLFGVTGLDPEINEIAQGIQHDLSYCRKIILDGDRIIDAEDPATSADRLLAFLFPLEMATVPSPIDVRQALASKLIQKGTPELLARSLVENFEEADCRCLERILK